jgi:eukaryotic-like serine/threonine-protein kinase
VPAAEAHQAGEVEDQAQEDEDDDLDDHDHDVDGHDHDAVDHLRDPAADVDCNHAAAAGYYHHDPGHRRRRARWWGRVSSEMSSTSTIAGRYRIEGRLGVGGMSTVHLAFDERLERYVAVKLLAEHLADDSTFVSRFRREALAAARLVHPNIVQVFDFGLDQDSNQHFIVMEHVPGHSCAELLRDRGHLDVEPAVEIVSQACRGLDYAHRNGVVHRDVKPGNLLVSGTEVVKLADFGIARATDQSSITQVGSVLGTAAYLAPEQSRGEEAGPRADLYSLGVVTYQLLSGRLPYEASSLSELALKQQRELPVPLDRLNPAVAPELARSVSMALSIDQESRPRDAMVLAALLRDGARGIAPDGPDAPTAHLGTRAATRVMAPVEPATAATGVVRRPPAAVSRPAGRPARAVASHRAVQPDDAGYAETAARAPRRGRFLRRFLALIALFALFVAAVVIAVVVATSTSNSAVQFRTVVGHDVNSAIHSLKGLIHHYTAK